MIILLGNFKGGVGKSTLTLALANYLTQEHRRWVAVLDLDFKQSLVNMQQKTQILETPSLYAIHSQEEAESINLLAKVKENPAKILLIDSAANLEESPNANYFSLADLIICPFSYDQFTIHATLLFALVISKLNPRAPLCFIPNRIKSVKSIESKLDIEKTLTNFGTLLPILNDKIAFQQVNNIHTPSTLLSLLMPTLDELYQQYIYK